MPQVCAPAKAPAARLESCVYITLAQGAGAKSYLVPVREFTLEEVNFMFRHMNTTASTLAGRPEAAHIVGNIVNKVRPTPALESLLEAARPDYALASNAALVGKRIEFLWNCAML